MKANIWLLGAILASSTLVTTAHADNATRVAATSALGSVVGTAIGKEIGHRHASWVRPRHGLAPDRAQSGAWHA